MSARSKMIGSPAADNVNRSLRSADLEPGRRLPARCVAAAALAVAEHEHHGGVPAGEQRDLLGRLEPVPSGPCTTTAGRPKSRAMPALSPALSSRLQARTTRRITCCLVSQDRVAAFTRRDAPLANGGAVTPTAAITALVTSNAIRVRTATKRTTRSTPKTVWRGRSSPLLEPA